jgi:hypothetical protein
MRALRIASVALITAIVGCVLGLVAGDYITELLHVSNFEGGRGYMVVFVCAPLGIITGFIIGLIVAIATKRPGFVGFLSAQGLALLIGCACAGILTGIIYLGVDKPPKIDGKSLTIDFELRVPPATKIPQEPDGYSVRASLYESNRQNRYGFIEWSRIMKSPDQITIPGTVEIMTHNPNRSLLASIGNELGASQFFELKIPAQPRKQDEVWSDWITATRRADLSAIPEAERFSLRYRVRELDR